MLDENKTKLVSQQILCCHNDVLVNKREAEEWMAVCVCVCVRRDDLFFIHIFFTCKMATRGRKDLSYMF